MKKLTLMILVAVGLVACSENENEQLRSSDRGITFAPQMVNDWNTTRGEGYRSMAETCITSQPLAEGLYLQTIVTTDFKGDGQQKAVTRGEKYVGEGETTKTFGNDETFYVSGYRYGSGETVADVTTANFLVSAPVTRKSGWWKAEQTFTMPYSGDKTDFFAWFVPKTEINEQVQTLADLGVSVVNSQGAPLLTYAVPETISKQPDLMTAVKRGEVYNDEDNYTVPLSFAHQLTAVNFVMDDNMVPGTITEIAFLNVYMSGTLTIGGTWDFTNGSKPNAREFDVNFPTVDSNNQQVAADSRTILDGLMMIPQTFTNANQKVRVTMTIDNQEQELFADLTSGDAENPNKWEAGKTVTYKISTSSVNTLRISGVTYPTTWGTQDITTIIKGDFATDDVLGVYGVKDNGDVVIDNQPLTKTSTGWSSSMLYVPGLKYFAYYPYQSAGLDHGTDITSAESFFASGISAWTPSGDQSDDDGAGLDKWDLQVAKGTEVAASTVSFTMARQMNLASLQLGDAEVGSFYKLDNDANYKWLHEGGKVTASSTFDTNKPYQKASIYYYVFAPVANSNDDGTLLKGLNNDSSEDWSLELKSTNHNISLALQTVYTNKTSTNTTENYTLAVGDVYYSNGAISHSLINATSNANYPQAIGMVYSLSTSAKDKQINANYKHGSVVSLKRQSTAVTPWATANSYAVNHQMTDVMYWYNDATTQRNAVLGDKEGLTHCRTAASDATNYANCTAMIAASTTFSATYPTPGTDKCSGWFLPSSGQLFELFRTICPNTFPTASEFATNVDTNRDVVVNKFNMNALETEYNSWFTAKEFGTDDFSGILGTGPFYYTSTEASAEIVYTLDMHYDTSNNNVIYTFRAEPTYKKNYADRAIRSVLVF